MESDIVLVEGSVIYNGTRQQTPADSAIGDEADTELVADAENSASTSRVDNEYSVCSAVIGTSRGRGVCVRALPPTTRYDEPCPARRAVP